jgi:iron(III) transport system substrate-binding protein
MPTRIAALAFLLFAAGALADPRLEQARKEGEVVWYTAMNIPDTEALKKPFLERYPFLSMTVLRATGEKVRTRILTEARANRFVWDIVSFNLLDMDALNREGLLASYPSPETRNGYPRGAVDPAGRWAAIYVRQYIIGYNTRQVKPGEAPASWADLLSPQWAGKLALDESDVEWFAAMLDYWGRDKATSYMRALSRQKPQQRRGHSLLTRLLVAGDFPLALVHASEIEKEKQEGAAARGLPAFERRSGGDSKPRPRARSRSGGLRA